MRTLSGGINIGQGEFPPSYSIGGFNAAPGPCLTPADAGTYSGEQLPYCMKMNVNVHHKQCLANLSPANELFSVTPADQVVSPSHGQRLLQVQLQRIIHSTVTRRFGHIATAGR